MPGHLAVNVLTDAATATNGAASKASIRAHPRRDGREARGGPAGRYCQQQPAGNSYTAVTADARGVTILAARVPVEKYSCSSFDVPTLQSFAVVRLRQVCRAYACSVAALHRRVGVQLLRGVRTPRITGCFRRRRRIDVRGWNNKLPCNSTCRRVTDTE